MSRNEKIDLFYRRVVGYKPLVLNYFILPILIAIVSTTTLRAQDITDKQISISFENISVDAALNRLYKEYSIKLAYSASDLQGYQIKHYSAENKAVKDVLSDILANTGCSFKYIGNQVVIFKDRNITDKESNDDNKHDSKKPKKEKHKENDLPQVPLKVSDTVFVHDTITFVRTDTIVRTDTLIKTETIRVVDTVIVYKRPNIKKRMEDVRRAFMGIDYTHNEKFSLRLSYSQYLTIINIGNNDIDHDYFEESLGALDRHSLRNYTVDLDGGYTYKNFDFNIGVSLNSLRHHFSFSDIIKDPSTFTIDTIDTYYNINSITHDTTYFHITDTVMIPGSEFKYNTFSNNNLLYLGLNFGVSYTFFRTERFNIFIKCRGDLNYLINAKGSFITENSNDKIKDLNIDEFNRVKFTLSGSIGVKYAISEDFDIVPEIYYNRYLGTITKEPLPTARLDCMGLRIGLYYYF